MHTAGEIAEQNNAGEASGVCVDSPHRYCAFLKRANAEETGSEREKRDLRFHFVAFLLEVSLEI